MTRRFILLLLGLFLLGACSRVRSSVDYDAEVDFGAISSWAWRSEKPPVSENEALNSELLHRRIRDAIARELTARGVRPSASRDEADVLVAYHISTRTRLETSSSSASFGYGSHGRYGSIGVSSSVSEYEEGTIIIDLVARDKDRLIWRGTGDRRLSRSSTPEKTTATVDEIVDAILAQYPPQP